MARCSTVTSILAVAMLTVIATTARPAQGQGNFFGCFGSPETFEGTFPPPGWSRTVSNNYGSTAGEWDRTLSSSYATGAGFSGYAAGSIYGDYILDTTLSTPSFSTVDVRDAKIEFSGYFYFYSGYGNKCDLQYSINGGATWTTLKTWDTYGSPALESIALPAAALGQPSVILRWDRYSASYPYYYALVDNVNMVCKRVGTSSPAPATSRWALAVLIVALLQVAVIVLRRRHRLTTSN